MRSSIATGLLALVFVVLPLAACKPAPLTAERAQVIIQARLFAREPVYAEVPQRVWWNAASPEDDYDGKALRTLRNLERAGLVTVTESREGGGESYQARVTQKGFNILGTMPSNRGPVYRAKIAEKKYDRLRDFVRHPTDPTVGRAALVWHYENPTWLYPLFETKINKPLNVPFVTLVSFHWEKQQWKVNIIVPKERAE